MSGVTGTYYDRLERWTALSRFFGYGGGRDTLTVHRALADPRAKGRPTSTRLHDLLVETLPPLTSPRVLDAGCGLGGTMIDLASKLGGTYTGLTLSERQAQIGRRAIARAGLEAQIEIQVGSYDSPPDMPFDVVLAIESLAHSIDPGSSLQAFTSRLAPGGLLAIVDDMPEPAASGSADLAAFKTGWCLPVLWSAEQYMTGMQNGGLRLVADRDLTPDVRPRSLRHIQRLEALNRVVRRFVHAEGPRAMLDSYRGGLALERLYRRKLVQYRLLVACRAGS
jgi:tocopherol O-methyltransferase